MFFRFYRLWVLGVGLCLGVVCLPAWASNFSTQTRVGLRSGDQWEPAIAADGYGHVYILYPQYLQNDRKDIVVARSVDFGLTWTTVVAIRTETEADKPVLAVHGLDVYVAYNRAAKVWVAGSHDGGNIFTPVNVNPGDSMGWAQAGGTGIAGGAKAVALRSGGRVQFHDFRRTAVLDCKQSLAGNLWRCDPIIRRHELTDDKGSEAEVVERITAVCGSHLRRLSRVERIVVIQVEIDRDAAGRRLARAAAAVAVEIVPHRT